MVLDLPAKGARELQSRKGVGSVRLEEDNNNRFRFAVDTNVPALLALWEPYTPRWCARIGIVLFVLYLVSGLDRALDGPDLGWEYSWNWPWQEPLSRASGDP